MSNIKVLLLSMPFASLKHPNLGLSLLKASLSRVAIDSEIIYFPFDYAETFGVELFDVLTNDYYYLSFVGDWVFSEAVHSHSINMDLKYCSDILLGEFKQYFTAKRISQVLSARRNASLFINQCFDKVEWSQYEIVGFSTSFQQNMASLALAKRIKEAYPNIKIIFGGANCDGEMGIELHRQYSFIDIICSGEGELVFPELVKRISGKQRYDNLTGIITRRDACQEIIGISPNHVFNMDDLPYPDFSDFFTQHKKCNSIKNDNPCIPVFETSRGCWWGEKMQCKFCGLNGSSISYRSKSQERAYDELQYIVKNYGNIILTVDNILNMDYFKEFLPALAESEMSVLLHIETKVNLKPQEIELLARAGVRMLQPGIESLNSEILKLMGKGCTMIQNVQTLKLAAECGISVVWNFLYGFPGEAPAHYVEMANIIPMLFHLNPPVSLTKIHGHRFSPYFNNPSEYGLTIEPHKAYQYIYPFSKSIIQKLAYYWSLNTSSTKHALEYIVPTENCLQAWHREHSNSELYCFDRDKYIEVVDRRYGFVHENHKLNDIETKIYRFCWRIRSKRDIAKYVTGFEVDKVETALSNLLNKSIFIQEDNKYLSLALRQPGLRSASTDKDIRKYKKNMPHPPMMD